MDIKETIPLSVIQCDINGLKIMNDAFGHQAGDELLMKSPKPLNKHSLIKGWCAVLVAMSSSLFYQTILSTSILYRG